MDHREEAQEVILQRGQGIDRFVVLGLVGRGGMGEVYAAYDPELDRKVAIKLLRARQGAGEEGKTRLLREAQAIAKLQHPNVVVVYDVGTFGESVFIAMEFIEGQTAGEWLRVAPRTRREILDVYLAAGRGLVAAHAAGLVHRDFKPDNVMVTNDGQVRVMDFGLARQSGEGDGKGEGETGEASTSSKAVLLDRGSSSKYLSLKLTQTGAMMGTPAYMAPEQFGLQPTDGRSDQFSFCVALYEALYGKRPFEGDNLIVLMANVTTGVVGAPPADARLKVPGWMRRILLRGLATDPAQRHPSLEALLAALKTDPTIRARRAAVGVVALALLAAAGMAARRSGAASAEMCRTGAGKWAGVWEPAGVSSARKQAIRAAFAGTGRGYADQAFAAAGRYLDQYVTGWLGMYTDACEATYVRGEQSGEVLDLRMACLQDRLASARALTDVFSTADGKVVESAVAAASALPGLDRCADIPLLKAVVKPPENEATRRRVAVLQAEEARLVALRDAGHCAEADKMAGELIAAVRATKYDPLLASVLVAAGRMWIECGDPNVAARRYFEAFSVALACRDDETAIQAIVLLPNLLAGRMRRTEEGRTWLEVGHGVLRRLGKRPLLEAWSLDSEANVLQAEGDAGAALAVALRARQAKEALLGKEHIEAAWAANNVALSQEMMGNYEESLAGYVAGRERMMRLLGADHPGLALIWANEGEVENILGHHAEARASYQQAVDTWRRIGADPMFVSFGLNGLGIALLGEGQLEPARAALQEALAIRIEKKEGPEQLGQTRFALARAMWARPAERVAALALARQAAADYARVEVPTAPAPDIAAWLRAPGVKAPPLKAAAARKEAPSGSPGR